MSNAIFPSQVRGLAFTVVKSQENSVMVKESKNYISTRINQNQNPRWHWRLEYSVVFDNPLQSSTQNTYSDLQTMIGFCRERKGTFDSFLFLDPDDNSVGPGIITASWQANFPYMLGAIVISATGHAQQVIMAPAGAKSGGAVPTFSIIGGTTTDGGLTWIDLGAVTGTGWPNPQAQLQVLQDANGNFVSPIMRNLGGQFWEVTPDLYGGVTVYDNGTPTGNYNISYGQPVPQYPPGIFLTWGNQPTGPVTCSYKFFFRVRFEEPTTDFEKWASQLWAIGGEQNVQGKGYLKMVSAPFGAQLNTNTVYSCVGTPPFPLPAGATNMIILSPNKIRTYPPSSTAIPYVAGGWAGGSSCASGYVGTWLQGLGSSGPTLEFYNFTPPPIPLQSVIAVAVWSPFTHTGVGAGCQGSAFRGVNPNTGSNAGAVQIASFLGGFAIGTFYSLSGPFGSNELYGIVATQSGGAFGGPISTFPYNTIGFFYGTSILNFTTSTDLMHPYPRLVVYF